MLYPINLTLLLLTLSIGAQDTISLTNGDKFTGSFQEIAEDQSIIFNFAEATEPLQIKPGGLDRLHLTTKTTTSYNHKEKITLINGDELPCTINSMDNTNFIISTSYAGEFTIPKSQVTKIQFDNKFQSIIYKGPKSQKEWATLEGWKYTSNSLSINGRGTASQKFNLPSNFILRFNLSWNNTNPKLSFHFGGNKNSKEKSVDRYYLNYNSAGFEMTRVTPRKYINLGRFKLKPRTIREKKLLIELRIDRQNNETVLYVDGQKSTTFSDKSPAAPLGEWILFESNQTNAQNATISNIEILEWSGSNLTKIKDLDFADRKSDILRDSQNLRYTGSAEQINRTGENLTILFNSESSKTPLKVPSNRASVIYFRTPDEKTVIPKPSYLADLNGGGKVSLGKTTIKDGVAIIEHPILGSCSIKISAITSLYTPE